MNYYPFHIGDYIAHTAHLDPVEDCAYRRLLDAYYLNEGPLNADVAMCARQIRMKANQVEVEQVLSEFFELTDAGWVHARCEAEIVRMRERQEDADAKASHEKERMRRHRERRAEMFEALREMGVVPAWDVAMKELQRLHDHHQNAHATHLQREQVISAAPPATAIPTPTPTPTPTPVNTPSDEGVTRKRSTHALADRPADVPESLWTDFQLVRKAKKAPLTDTALDGIKREAAKAGVTLQQALTVCCEAGWQGFQADWHANRVAGRDAAAAPSRRTPVAENFAAKDYGTGVMAL